MSKIGLISCLLDQSLLHEKYPRFCTFRHFVQNAARVDGHVVTHQSPHSWGQFRFGPIFGILRPAGKRFQRGLEGFWACGGFRGDNGVKRRAELLEGKLVSDARPLQKERALESEGTSTIKQRGACLLCFFGEQTICVTVLLFTRLFL